MKYVALALTAFWLAACGQPKTVLVEGVGRAERAPEFATISAEVSADADTVDAAVASSSKRVEAVTKGLKDFGVEQEQVHAADFGVRPICDYDDTVRRQVCHGYEASHLLSITVSDFERLGVVLGALAQLGVDRIEDTSFDVRDRSALENEARQNAMSDAKAKAKLYAEANGMTLSSVLGIEDRDASDSSYSRYSRRIQGVPALAQVTSSRRQIVVTGSRVTRVPLFVPKVRDEEVIYMEFALSSAK